MARPSSWPDKVMTLLRGGNTAAAIAQIQAAPSVKELQALQKAITATQLAGRWRDVDDAVADSLRAMSAPRLHRSP